MTTRNEIESWLTEAKENGARWVMVVCDSFDHSDYPIEFTDPKEVWEKYLNPGSMQRVMEVYDLELSIVEQLSKIRAFSLPEPNHLQLSEEVG